jgi:hypothetical protein
MIFAFQNAIESVEFNEYTDDHLFLETVMESIVCSPNRVKFRETHGRINYHCEFC